MTDVHSREQRRKNMSAIKHRDTKPELQIAQLLQELQLDFQAQVKVLDTRPDFYLPQQQLAVFIHGCFWHGHHCHLFKVPATRTDFWLNKIEGNRNRDQQVRRILNLNGIRYLVVWECSLKGKLRLAPNELSTRIEEFILAGGNSAQISHMGFEIEP